MLALSAEPSIVGASDPQTCTVHGGIQMAMQGGCHTGKSELTEKAARMNAGPKPSQVVRLYYWYRRY